MDWKKIGKKLLYPPVWLIGVLSVISAVALTAVFLKGWENTPIAYGSYGVSAYALTVLCIFCTRVLPGKYRQIKKKISNHPLGNRYLTDRVFRTKASLHISLGINLLYVVIQLVSWYINRSWWFVVLAVYYVILSVMRFLLVGYVRHSQIGSDLPAEWRRARVCAGVLLLLNLFLSGAVLMILYQGRGFAYQGVLIYVMAAYSFYSTIHAVVDIVRYRKLGSPVMTTAKVVSLSAALVSMLSLETAMFSQFGADMALQDQRIMIAATGAGVSITVITLSVLLIVHATRQLKK